MLIIDKTKSTIIRKACTYCGKLAKEANRATEGRKIKIKLECGHTTIEYLEEETKEWQCEALSGKRPFPYQYKTLDFIINSNFRTGIFHEQGVGKTICALMPIAKFPAKLMPFVVVCKSSLKAQWWKEILDWTGQPAQIISSGSDKPFPVFKAFIISYDLIKNNNIFEAIEPKLVILDECQQIKNSQAKRTQALRLALSGKRIVRKRTESNSNLPKRQRLVTIAKDLMKYHGVSERFLLNFEELDQAKLGLCECHATQEGIIEGKITISQRHAENDPESDVIETILHEIAHAITPGAGHKKIWQDTSIAIGGDDGTPYFWCNGTIEPVKEFSEPIAVFALSGTPIKNHAGEYFPILNILHPEMFPSQAQFERDYVDTYQNGFSYKIGGLRRGQADDFKNLTESFITRYTRDEVLPDLPKIFRKNFFVELGEEVEKAYYKAYIEFREEYLEGGENILAKLNRMRHLTGISKILPVTDFVKEFLEETDRKIALFVHHKDVGLGLYNNIKNVCDAMKIPGPIQLTSENAGTDVGNRLDELWKNDSRQRIMVASTLSAGEGKNWQMCSDMIMVEHQWNPANEEQCEGRFPRPGATAESISATYAIALGTPDEYLTEIKERKREICKKTLGNESVSWNESSVIKELSELLIQRGGKRWKL